jgi:inner membrane protein
MATFYTHAFVGFAAARLYADRPMPWRYWGLAVILPVIPDLDVFLTGTYGTAWGHRGFTHSLVFALSLAIIAASPTFKACRVSWWSLPALFFTIVASHGLLDAMTRGGENVPFFWPFSGRYGNWGPLLVSDIAFDLPDPRYSRAIRAELLWIWLPMSVAVSLAMLYRRRRYDRSDHEN